MKNFSKIKVIRISEPQLNTLQKMKSYNVDVGKFIREAIAEKIQREYNIAVNGCFRPQKWGFFCCHSLALTNL
jgi:hypothetical protein